MGESSNPGIIAIKKTYLYTVFLLFCCAVGGGGGLMLCFVEGAVGDLLEKGCFIMGKVGLNYF